MDMDNVLADFDRRLYSDLAARHPGLVPRERRNFLFGKDYPEYTDDINDIIYSRGFYDSLPLVESAVNGLRRIIKNDMEPVICSTPLDSDFCIDDKLSWINRELVPVFGKNILHSAEFTLDKSLSEGLVLIDDNPNLEKHVSAGWEQILFLHDYGRDKVAPRYTIENWNDQNLEHLLRGIKEKRWVNL